MPSGILHTAVLNSDLPTLRLMREDRLLKYEIDSDGFNPVEIARYLDKTQCLKVLREWNPVKVKAFLRDNASTQVELNEADISKLLNFHYAPSLIFDSYEFFLETLKNCPITYQLPLFGTRHRNLGESYLSLKRPELTIKWIDDTMGYGLFSEAAIPKESLIGEYAGMVRRLDYKKPDSNGFCAHYPTKWFSRSTYTMIDAQQVGNELRYINHSDSPNLKAAWANDRKLLHLLFFAKEDIPANTQLTINYGQDYWETREKR